MTGGHPRTRDPQTTHRIRMLWHAALSGGLHTSGCGCCGGFCMRLTAEMLEETLLDFLADRELPEVIEVVETRRANQAQASFPEWVLALALPDEVASRIEQDLIAVLESIGRHAGVTFTGVAANS